MAASWCATAVRWRRSPPRRERLASAALRPMLSSSLGGSGIGRAEMRSRDPLNLNRIMPAEGRRGCVSPHGAFPPPRGGEHATEIAGGGGAGCGAGVGAGEARARHLHLRELRLRVGAGAADRGQLRGGLRLRRAVRRRRRRGGAAGAAAARGRAQPGGHRAGARHQPDGGGEGDRALRAARDRGPGAGSADRLGRRGLPALRLGLFRLRLRQGGDARAAGELRGTHRVGGQHRHPRPAQLDAGAGAADVGQGCLWRPGAGDLGGAGAACGHRRAGMGRGLRAVPERRGGHGAGLHHLARLPPHRRGRRHARPRRCSTRATTCRWRWRR